MWEDCVIDSSPREMNTCIDYTGAVCKLLSWSYVHVMYCLFSDWS